MNNTSDETDKENALQAVERVRQVLESAGLTPESIDISEEARGFALAFEENVPETGGVAFVLHSESKFLFYVNFLRRVPEETIPQVVEFITRANYGISIGNYELDYSIRSVRYKSSVDFEGAELPPALIRNVIVAAIDGVEAYGAALVDVMEGSKTPEQAIKDAESGIYEDC